MNDAAAAPNSVSPMPTRVLAEFAASLTLERTPPQVVQRSKELLLDYLSTVVPAINEDAAKRLIAFATKMGGPKESRILGTGLSVAAPWAALVNGSLGHMMELDDTHRRTAAHPGDSVWAVALAMGERQGVSGAELIAAAVAGYEVALRIGEAVMPDHYRRGWHTSGTIMSFGAAVTAGKLLKLNSSEMGWALGTAGAQASGNFAHLTERAMTKDFNCGHAAKSGVIAALLAAEGFTGPTNVIEGARGFMALYGERTFPERLTQGLGSTWRTMEVSQKAYSGCRYSHAGIDAVLALRKEHGFSATDVRKVTARIMKTGALLVDDPVPWEGDKGLQGTRFSAHFNLAVALLFGRPALWDLLDNEQPLRYRDMPEVRDVMQRIEVIPDEELDKNFPEKWSTVVDVDLVDGRHVSCQVDWPTGEPETPMDADSLGQKFRRLTALAGWTEQQAQALVPDVMTLDEAGSLEALLKHL